MLRFFLDGVETARAPKGADSLSERLYYSEELWCNLSEINGNVIFDGEDRDYIFELWKENSCGLIEFEIQKTDSNLIYQTEFKGYIFLSDVIFDDNANEVECEVVDNSYIAMINNNKDIKMNLGIPTSKNLVDISSYYTTNPIGEVFTFSPGGASHSGRLTISVYDALAALVAFMSDGQIEFDSEFFDYNAADPTEGNQYFLITGSELFTGAGEFLPTISFQELFTDLHRCYNLRIGIEKHTNGKPLIRIEPKSYFRSTNTIDIDSVNQLKFRRKPNNEYTQILVGNKTSDDNNTFQAFDYLWNTWKTREYFLQGQCNDVDQELNLKFDTLCPDVRVIEMVADGILTEDEKIFLYAEPIFNGGADEFWNPFEIYVPGINYNNKNTRNGVIIDRWSDDIFSPVALLDYAVNDMKSELTSPQTITGLETIVFDNDSTGGNYDNGNTYDNTTGEYECLITGTYRIRTTLTLAATGGTGAVFEMGIAFGFAGGGPSIYWFSPGATTVPPGLQYTLAAGESIELELEYEAPLLEGTDIAGSFPAVIAIQVEKISGTGTLTVDSGSTFEVITPASGTFRDFSANEAHSKQIELGGAISTDVWSQIKTNRSYLLNAQGTQVIHQGYIQDLERNILNGNVTGTLLGRMPL